MIALGACSDLSPIDDIVMHYCRDTTFFSIHAGINNCVIIMSHKVSTTTNGVFLAGPFTMLLTDVSKESSDGYYRFAEGE